MHVACRRDSDRCFCWFLAAVLVPMLMGTNMVSLYKALKFGKVILCDIFFLYSMYASLVNSNHMQLYDCCKSSTNWWWFVLSQWMRRKSIPYTCMFLTHAKCCGAGGAGNFHKKIYCLLSCMCWHLVIWFIDKELDCVCGGLNFPLSNHLDLHLSNLRSTTIRGQMGQRKEKNKQLTGLKLFSQRNVWATTYRSLFF